MKNEQGTPHRQRLRGKKSEKQQRREHQGRRKFPDGDALTEDMR